MKFGNKEVLDILVFDLNENLVTKLDTLLESKLFKQKEIDGTYYYLIAKDALLDENILKFIGTESNNKQTDMQSYLNNGSNDRTIVFSKDQSKKCKLLAKTLFRQQTNGEDKAFTFEFPEVSIVSDFSFESVLEKVSAFDLVFKISPYNEFGDMFRLHIKE